MYSELSLYYLHQLGITPWISKEDGQNLPSQRRKLLVLIPSTLSKKAYQLLNKMLAYIDCRDNEVLTMNHFKEQHSKLLPSDIILALTDQSEVNLSKDKLCCPVFLSLSPEYLLQYPHYKKKVFADLMAVKNQIVRSV